MPLQLRLVAVTGLLSSLLLAPLAVAQQAPTPRQGLAPQAAPNQPGLAPQAGPAPQHAARNQASCQQPPCATATAVHSKPTAEGVKLELLTAEDYPLEATPEPRVPSLGGQGAEAYRTDASDAPVGPQTPSASVVTNPSLLPASAAPGCGVLRAPAAPLPAAFNQNTDYTPKDNTRDSAWYGWQLLLADKAFMLLGNLVYLAGLNGRVEARAMGLGLMAVPAVLSPGLHLANGQQKAAGLSLAMRALPLAAVTLMSRQMSTCERYSLSGSCFEDQARLIGLVVLASEAASIVDAAFFTRSSFWGSSDDSKDFAWQVTPIPRVEKGKASVQLGVTGWF